MTTVLMQKAGEADIFVDSTNVTPHEALGWRRAKISISADGQTLNFPKGAAIAFDVGAMSITGMQVLHYAITPAANSATAIHAAVTLHATLTTVVTTAISNPDVPRTLTIKGNAVNIAGNVVIVGTDVNGVTISDTIALNGVAEVEGVKAFATVTRFTLPPRTTAGDTVSIGYAKKFGMPQILKNVSYLLTKLFDAAADIGTLTLDADISKNLFALDGTPNGSKVIDLIYLD
jgi:hypothetical protein